jgi:long-chain fatty acid transport protein
MAAAIFGFSRGASASGFAATRFGGEHGNVTTTNPTALYYNPAGMAFGAGASLFIDGSLALRRVTYQHAQAPTDALEPPGAEGAQFGKAELLNLFGGPMLGATKKLGNLALGVSLCVPFGGRAHWGKNEKFRNDPNFPLAVDGVQRWHSIDGAITFIYLSGGLAYRIGRLSVGATGNFIMSSVKNTQAKTPVGTGDPDLMREGRAVLDVSGTHGSFAAGAMLEAIKDRLLLGVSYQAQPGLGPIRLTGTVTSQYQGTDNPIPVNFNQSLPDVVRVGARLRLTPASEVRLSGDFTRWSVMRTQCVGFDPEGPEGGDCAVFPDGSDATGGYTIQNLRRRWKDTYAVRAGGSYWLVPAVELFAGAAFETAATPDESLDTNLPDSHNFAGALGGRFQLGGSWFVGVTYTHVQYLDRDTTGKSRLAEALLPSKMPDSGGKYTQWISVLNMNVEKQF